VSATSISFSAASRRRLSRAHVTNRAFTILLWSAGILALLPLGFIVGYVVLKGVGILSIHFFTKTPAIVGQPGGGIAQAFLGSALIVGMATLFSIPLGLLAAVYLAEYGTGRFATVVRFLSEVLLSTPSIVAGVLVWTVVVVRLHAFSAFAGALAITVLMWPIIARTTEELLRLVPESFRDGALALGATRAKAAWSVVLPAALPGILTGILVALARVARGHARHEQRRRAQRERPMDRVQRRHASMPQRGP